MVQLKKIRIAANMTQNELAEKVGVTRTAVSKWEAGRMPTPKTAQRIAAVLGFDWTLFFEPPADTDKSA